MFYRLTRLGQLILGWRSSRVCISVRIRHVRPCSVGFGRGVEVLLLRAFNLDISSATSCVLHTSHYRLHKKAGMFFLALMYPRLDRAKNGVFSTASSAGAAAAE